MTVSEPGLIPPDLEVEHPMTNAEEAAVNMKLARQLAGMTQEDAAHALDVTVRTYARWERGETRGFMGELERIAKVFDTTRESLLGEGGDQNDGATESQIAALRAELAEVRALLLDPEALRRAADALTAEEGQSIKKRTKGKRSS